MAHLQLSYSQLQCMRVCMYVHIGGHKTTRKARQSKCMFSQQFTYIITCSVYCTVKYKRKSIGCFKKLRSPKGPDWPVKTCLTVYVQLLVYPRIGRHACRELTLYAKCEVVEVVDGIQCCTHTQGGQF